jgi:hypothetical protein
MRGAARTAPSNPAPHGAAAVAPPRRSRVVGISILLIIVFTCIAFLLGLYTANNEIASDRDLIGVLRTENQTLNKKVSDLNAEIARLQTTLTNTRSQLDAILPSKDRYYIGPNESRIVADGHLTIGLVGPPTNDKINLNINGKTYKAAAGDTIKVAFDPSTNCQVTVQSFDMFQAVLTASCAAGKAQ